MIFESKDEGHLLVADLQKQNSSAPHRWQGALLSSDLEELLDQEGCVGIRVYNVLRVDKEKRRIIAVGISSEGDELNQPTGSLQYIMAGKSRLGGAASKMLDRAEAKAQVESGEFVPELGPNIFFASVFSRSMLETLLTPGDCDAVQFYLVDQVNGMPGPTTHCAVSTKTNAQGSLIPDNAVYMLSTRPCPGFCLNADIELESTEFPKGVASTPGSDTTKYLVAW